MSSVIASINFPSDVHGHLVDLQKWEAGETLRKVSASKIVSRLVKQEYEKVKTERSQNNNGLQEQPGQADGEQNDGQESKDQSNLA